jgi:hypothetical protein
MMDITPNSEPEVSLDLPNVAKHNWKSQEIRDHWQNDLARFTDAWDELVIEALLDEQHPRNVVTREVELGEGAEWVSQFPESIDTEVYTGDNTQLVAAATTGTVDPEILVNGEVEKKTEQQLAGTPACCASHSDDIVAVAENSPSCEERGGELVIENPKPILNQLWRYMGWGFTSFVPCSFSCDAAFQVAVRNGELLRELGYGAAADMMYSFLTSPAYWSGYHGLAHVKNGWSIGEHTTEEDNWQEQTVRFNGYHEELADLPAE